MKWYRIDIPYYTEERRERVYDFISWLNDHEYEHRAHVFVKDLKYIHFDIYASPEDVDILCSALEKIVWLIVWAI